ncbi:MAG: hypothetical protein AAGD10_21625 [Myxococcota bacterium]
MRAALRLQRVGAPQAAEAKARELDTPPEPKLGPVLTKRLRNYFLRKQGKLTTPSRHAVSISASGRKLVDLWRRIRALRYQLRREAFQWAREALFLQKAEAYLRVTEPVIERPVASERPPNEIQTLVLEPAEPEVLEVDDEMVLEVVSAGEGEGLELGRAAEEPETLPQLNVKSSPTEPKVQETEPSPPAAPSTAEDKAQER